MTQENEEVDEKIRDMDETRAYERRIDTTGDHDGR